MDPSGSKGSETDGALPWQRATIGDLDGLNFEAPIAACKSAGCHDLSDLFLAAAQSAQSGAPETSAARAFMMLSAICGFHFKPSDRNEPFGPFFRSADRRSAVPEDFRGAPLNAVAYMAERVTNVVLRARLNDLCWLLDRKKSDAATLAITAYVEIVHRVKNGTLSFPFEKSTVLAHDTRDILRRALQIGRAIGWDKPETISARDLVVRVRELAASQNLAAPVLRFSDLDLDFGISDPKRVAACIEAVLQKLKPDASHIIVELWRTAARAYHFAKSDDDAHRCQAASAECLVEEADSQKGSSMLAAHWLSAAISEYHGVPNKRERRTELRHKLIDIQAHIPDEMSVFSQTMDLTEIAEAVTRSVAGKNLLDKLLIFASLAQSPNPEELRQNAVKTVQEFPLASLFGATHHDREGKVTHRSEGSGDGGDFDPAISRQIAQNEEIRRRIVVGGSIEPARLAIMTEHYLSDEVFVSLLRYSAFVPRDQLTTFSRAYTHFFQGDYISAVYILTPLLESSLRYVLKSHGHDVTIFDDATQVQEDRTLSSIFEQMKPALESVFGTAIVSDLENIFLRRPGPSLRNAVAHGLLGDGGSFDPDAIYGCSLIFRLCCLPIIPHRKDIDIVSA